MSGWTKLAAFNLVLCGLASGFLLQPGHAQNRTEMKEQQSNKTAKSPFPLQAEQSVLSRERLHLEDKVDTVKPKRVFSLDTSNFSLGGATQKRLLPAKSPTMDTSSTPFHFRVTNFSLESSKNVKLLADYNMELIVDRSMSMRIPDCPGGVSRWQWCGDQALNLATALSPYVPNGLTIVPFATEYDVFEHATTQNVDDVFNGMGLQFGTRLFEPLSERLDNYFARYTAGAKPLLIVVITDGIPSPPRESTLVRQELIATSHKMISPNQVTVIFCQIGHDDPAGQRFLVELDERLMTMGARYQFVHTITFDRLEEMQLGPALIKTMKDYAATKLQNVDSINKSKVNLTHIDTDFHVLRVEPEWRGFDNGTRRPDRFADSPHVDACGIRHFANGRYFDLSKMSIDQALSTVNQPPLPDR